MKTRLLTLISLVLFTSNIIASSSVLDLSNPTQPSTIDFDTEKKYWTETYNDSPTYTWLQFQNFKLAHLIGQNSYGGTYWNGFTLSTSGDNTDYSSTGWTGNQWGCMAGGGIKTDQSGAIVTTNGVVDTEQGIPYLVANYSAYVSNGYSNEIKFADGQKYEAVEVYVTNHPWPYYENMNGGMFTRVLDQEGDYVKLIANGLDENGNSTGSASFYLAKFENGSLTQVTNWEKFDLSALGTIASLYFTIESTDTGDYGMNTAAYFCMDKLTVKEYTTSIPQLATENAAYRVNNILYNIPENATITVYNLQGQLVYSTMATSNTVSLPIVNNHLIIKIVNENNTQIIR
ncbi:MAG: DUF4465 domain-containing protein [Paludibacteraceae bacterium]|nr:DUF4465 domain-containing protein [Paludibacteraceae bacterium]